VSDLRLEIGDGVATVTLDRADALNALTVSLKEELRAALDGLATDDAVRAIPDGADRAFCTGQDR
jgi:2-(1,2-epoxy-1,2-dihydrophenyl)acetyl-CoA isomerase